MARGLNEYSYLPGGRVQLPNFASLSLFKTSESFKGLGATLQYFRCYEKTYIL